MDAMADVIVRCIYAIGIQKTHALGVTMGAVYTMLAAA